MTSRIEEEREYIRAAMERLLNGMPEGSDGSLTISALAAEAGILRQRLYEYHSDMLGEFRASSGLRASGPNVTALQRQIDQLKERSASLSAENDVLRDKIRTLAAIIAELTHEAASDGNVIVAMPRRRSRQRSGG